MSRISNYELSMLNLNCVATHCHQTAYVLRRAWEAPPPQGCGAFAVMARLDVEPDAGLRPLKEALSACACSCNERLAACRSGQLEALREVNVRALRDAARVRSELRRLLD